jgi:hypothetical protein
MPGDEHELAVCRAARIPLQVVANRHRLAVFIDPENGKVQVVARIREVVRIAAVKRNLLFGREDEPDIRVPLVAIEPILAALIERDDLAVKLRLLIALGLYL